MESTQRAAQASLEWFENIGQVVGQEQPQFAFNLLTRSRRVTYDNLRTARPGVRRRASTAVLRSVQDHDGPPPLFQPLPPGRTTLKNRIVTAPVATYTARDGVPGDEEELWLASAALGGSALVLAGNDRRERPRAGPRALQRPLERRTGRGVARRSSPACHRVSTALIGRRRLTHAGRRRYDLVGRGPSPIPYRRATPDRTS